MYWKDPQKLSRHIARQRLDLMEFDIEIQHLPGRANGRADALSRWPDYDTGIRNNENVIVIPEHVMVQALEVVGTQPTQDKSTLLPWVDPHKLKKVENIWYKDGCLVVTRGLPDKQIICADTMTLQRTVIQESTKPLNL